MSQKSDILAHLSAGHQLTPIDALKLFGCFRLGARIYDLKQDGHMIYTTMVERGKKRFARYTLIKQKD